MSGPVIPRYLRERISCSLRSIVPICGHRIRVQVTVQKGLNSFCPSHVPCAWNLMVFEACRVQMIRSKTRISLDFSAASRYTLPAGHIPPSRASCLSLLCRQYERGRQNHGMFPKLRVILNSLVVLFVFPDLILVVPKVLYFFIISNCI